MSSTPTQTSLYSSTHFFTPSVSHSPSATSSQSQSVSFTLTLIPSPSISFSHDLTQTPSPSFSLLPSPSFTRLPSPSSTQKCILTSTPTTTLGSISDNTFYVIIFTIVALFFINTSYSIHYYNAYTNEKTRRRLIVDQVQTNPYHTTVRDTFNRV
jgi:hypothetical protein